MKKDINFTIFLDRDGVINIDSPDYIKCEDEFHFIQGSAEAIAIMTRAGFDIIIITNQSAIGRNMITSGVLDTIFNKMKHGVKQAGGTIKDIFYCPHTPDSSCTCRKPAPGLIFQAVEKYGIDLARSCMVGDSAKDILCARNAGCALSLLVRTGNGEKALIELEQMAALPDMTAVNLMEASKWIISHVDHIYK